MNKSLSLAFFFAGIVLLGSAFFAGDSVSSGISKLFQKAPDYLAMIIVAIGLLGLIAGTVSLSRSPHAE